jgi:uncharacterized protein
MMQYKKRTYRQKILNHNFNSYNVIVKETDLFITSDTNETEYVLQSIHRYRSFIESYIQSNPQFLTSLKPISQDPFAPEIIRNMIECSTITSVGPMAAVAGAIAQFVGFDLLKLCSNVIIENGGDIFLKMEQDAQVGLFAGKSPLSEKIHIRIKKEDMPMGLCTSSGTVGSSLSFGRADAVCVKAKSASLADAAATALGNKIKSPKDVKKVLNDGLKIPGILGIVIVIERHMGVCGDMELF